jgi:hypothetical protein
MSTTETATDRDAITAVVQLYIDGSATGDASKLKQAFHPEARMYGSLGDQRLDMPIAELYPMLEAKPMDVDGSYEASVTAVDQVDDAAIARLEESGCWGNVSFVDFFLLARIDGSWKIVSKSFAHTGGEPPAG